MVDDDGEDDEDEDEDEDEDDDVTEDEEFVLCTLLRGMNIRVTSSALMEFRPPCPPSPLFHLGRALVGETMAVIGRESNINIEGFSLSALPRAPCLFFLLLLFLYPYRCDPSIFRCCTQQRSNCEQRSIAS